MSVSAPLPPLIASRPSPPSAVSAMSAARAPALSVSLPPSPLTVSRSLAASDWSTFTCSASPVTWTVAPAAAAWTMSGAAVPLTTTTSAATSPTPPTPSPTLTKATPVPGKLLRVVVSAPAERVDVQRLRGEEVESAVDPDMAGRRPRGDAEHVGAAGAVHGHRVEPRPGGDLVGAVAGVPREGVVAGAEEHLVGPCVPVDDVVARAAVQRLGEAPTDERVDAVAAVERRLLGVGERARGLVDPEPVVAAAAVDHDPREAAAEEGEVGAPVVLDVDHEAPAGGRPQADPLTCAGARDRQPPVRDRCVHRRLRLRRQAERGRQDGGGDQNA